MQLNNNPNEPVSLKNHLLLILTNYLLNLYDPNHKTENCSSSGIIIVNV